MSIGETLPLREGKRPAKPKPLFPSGASRDLSILSRLLLCGEHEQQQACAEVTPENREAVLALAHTNHVVIRAIEALRWVAAEAQDREHAQWATNAIEREQARIDNALAFLKRMCDALEAAGCGVVVIKSLDHWPDLGSDLDLFTNARPEEVVRLMNQRFDAQLATRSWGDRLANKWNFIVPGLPELIEVHVGRLGQTGELVSIANTLAPRTRLMRVMSNDFRVLGAEDRLMICTLQRMYRHFYARLCDIVDTAALLETNIVDYDRLRSLAQTTGIWEGVATFLKIVSDYAEFYRRCALDLPSAVTAAARFGGDQVFFNKSFLRVPILPHSARLYASEWTTLMTKGELRNAARLSLLPCLATAAALRYKVTGSDKGIW